MIKELLSVGAENAKTAKELSRETNYTTREITRMIAQERRSGAAICASCEPPFGFYLAADREEMENYCGRLYHRAGEIFKTRRACIKSMDELPARKGE